MLRGIGKDGHVVAEGLESDHWVALDIGKQNLALAFFQQFQCRRRSRILKWGLNFPHLNQRNQRNQILFQYLMEKKNKRKKGAQKKGGGGENSPISPPLDPRLQ